MISAIQQTSNVRRKPLELTNEAALPIVFGGVQAQGDEGLRVAVPDDE